jgi:heme-degrading monooxygenase HmoA
MIARTWHGAVRAADGDRYFQYIKDTGLGDYARAPGNRGVHVLRRTEGEVTHFLLLTLWESWDAIRGFAGADPEKARYYPKDAEFLLELEPTVTHYEVLESS